jgi:type IV pilus assembly protein PilW
LIEIMVAMAIGLVVIGAVLSTYLHSRAGSRQAAAMAQVTEDASLAMGILRSHVSMAGYGQPTGSGSSFKISRLTGAAIIGCDGGFNGGMVINPTRVNCTNGDGTPDALIVRYEVDDRNGPQVADASGSMLPADCQGTGLTKGAAPYDYFVSDSRFSIGSGTGVATALECRGSGGIANTKADDPAAATAIFGTGATVNPSVSLVNNIQDMQILYGLDKAGGHPVTYEDGTTGTKYKRVATYLKAATVGTPTSGNWDRVVSIRVCIVVRSEEEVLDSITPYRGCNANTANPTEVKTPPDRRIYRAFTTTIVLNNRT